MNFSLIFLSDIIIILIILIFTITIFLFACLYLFFNYYKNDINEFFYFEDFNKKIKIIEEDYKYLVFNMQAINKFNKHEEHMFDVVICLN